MQCMSTATIKFGLINVKMRSICMFEGSLMRATSQQLLDSITFASIFFLKNNADIESISYIQREIKRAQNPQHFQHEFCGIFVFLKHISLIVSTWYGWSNWSLMRGKKASGDAEYFEISYDSYVIIKSFHCRKHLKLDTNSLTSILFSLKMMNPAVDRMHDCISAHNSTTECEKLLSKNTCLAVSDC